MARKINWAIWVVGFLLMCSCLGLAQSGPTEVNVSEILQHPAKYKGRTVRVRAAVARTGDGPKFRLDGIVLLNERAPALCHKIYTDHPWWAQNCSGIVVDWYAIQTKGQFRGLIELLQEEVEKNTKPGDTQEALAMLGAILGKQSFESAYAAEATCPKGDCWGCYRYDLTGLFVGKLTYQKSRNPKYSSWAFHMDLASVSDLKKTDLIGKNYDKRCYEPEAKQH